MLFVSGEGNRRFQHTRDRWVEFFVEYQPQIDRKMLKRYQFKTDLSNRGWFINDGLDDDDDDDDDDEIHVATYHI